MKPIIEITVDNHKKKTWKFFKEINKINWYDIDLRKSSKNYTPLRLQAMCCNDILRIKRIKDFPLNDLKCKCWKEYLIKWIIKK
jgi:hypothetical protein